MRRSGMCAVVVTMVLTSAVVTPAAASGPGVIRVSVSTAGTQANSFSHSTAVSAGCRYIAFTSYATNLAVGDTDGLPGGVFVRDRRTGTTQRVSVSSSGADALDESGGPQISGDGRYVSFTSGAANLAPRDTNGAEDAFVHDRRTRRTQRISVSAAGVQGNGWSLAGPLSADGRYVVFSSFATNLVRGDTNGEEDVFVRDQRTGTISRVSVSHTGAQASQAAGDATISADGRYVAFLSTAEHLVPGDTNDEADVFVRDRLAGTTRRVNVTPAGRQADRSTFQAAISGNGRYVVFSSYATTLVPGDTNDTSDVFVRDLGTGDLSRVSVSARGEQATLGSDGAVISADGRHIAFRSQAANLAPGTFDGDDRIFVRDRRLGTIRVGPPAAWYSPLSIGDNGRCVAFASGAPNLVPDDTNEAADVFLYRY